VAGKLNSAKNIVDFTCFVHSENRKYVPCRIIASRLPEDKAAAAVLRRKRSSLKRQSAIRENTLVYAEWVIMMTSLSYDYSAHDILELYRARWQMVASKTPFPPFTKYGIITI